MNTYFDRRFAVDCGWSYHPKATGIADSKLAADFRKTFGPLSIQAEVQFGNMARWYSDIFKMQAGYAQSLVELGLCVVPMASLAKRIDSNITHYERVIREIASARLSITLPILVVGLEPDPATPLVDASKSSFRSVKDFTGKGKEANRWRIVNGYLNGAPLASVGPDSPTGPLLTAPPDDDLSEEE